MTRTFFVPIENDMVIESWMTAPFESCSFEEEIEIEVWMTTAWI